MSDQGSAILLIQQALTPVFLIVGIGALINSITTRLGRIIDRVRWFDLPSSEYAKDLKAAEMKALGRRMRYANWSINFLSAACMVVCINIMLLVIDGYFAADLQLMVIGTFMFSLVLLLLGVACFLLEVSLATASLQV